MVLKSETPRLIDEAANNLLKIKHEIEKDINRGIQPKALCVICSLSKAAYISVFVVPITALAP